MKLDEAEWRDKMAKTFINEMELHHTTFTARLSFCGGWDACLKHSHLVRQMVEVLTDMLNENNSAPYVANLLIQRYREAIK